MIYKKLYGKRKDGTKLYRIFSNKGMMILQNETGTKYAEAIDVENAPYTYTETDEPIPTEEEDMTEITEKAKAYDILMGVEE